MEKMIRFSFAGILGVGITAALFIGMLSLLSDANKPVQNKELEFKFSWVNEYEEVKTTPRDRPEEPKPLAVSQAPAMPAMQPEIGNKTAIDMPLPNSHSNNMNLLEGFKFNGVGTGPVGIPAEPGGGLKSGMPPLYPQAQLAAKTEGWVKVLIDVNEFGQVSHVEILQAKPARVFNANTKKAVRKWQFHPKMVDGQAVPYQVTQTIEFTIDQP